MIPKLEHLFVSHHTSVALKKLKFNDPCIAYYWAEKPTFHYTVKYYDHNLLHTRASAPLFDQVIEWFERIHFIAIETALDETLSWVYRITPTGPESSIDQAYESKYVYCGKRRDAIIDAINHVIILLTNDNSSKQE